MKQVLLLTTCTLLYSLSQAQTDPNYIQNQVAAEQPAAFWINGVGRTSASFRVYKDGAASQIPAFVLKNAADNRGASFQLTEGTNPGLATWITNLSGVFYEATVLDVAGNFGVGKRPSTKLDINGHTRTMGSFLSDVGTGINYQLRNGTGVIRWGIGSVGTESGSNTGYDYVINRYTDAGALASSNDFVIQRTNGFVGIGTTTPAYKLDVTGDAGFSGNLLIDPKADAFRSYAIKRLNAPAATYSQAALVNNKTYAGITWFPDIATTSVTYGLNVGANMLNYYNNGTTETVWRSGNMGTGSGLNADMVDGLHAPSLFRYGVGTLGDPTTYVYPAPGSYFNTSFQPANGIPNNNYGVYTFLNLSGDGTYSGLIAMGTNSGSLYTKRKVANTWETSWRTIWDSNNFDPANYLPLTGGSLTGKLIIGTTAAQRDLDVNGTIKTRKIKVTTTDWADYVFDSAYTLAPLQHVEAFIKQNKHLPDVPSAATVKKEGVDLADNQVTLLKKIEELTLYIIEQNKQVQDLKLQVKELQEKVK